MVQDPQPRSGTFQEAGVFELLREAKGRAIPTERLPAATQMHKARIERIATATGRNAYVVLAAHRSEQTVNQLRDLFQSLRSLKVDPKDWLFVVEGVPRINGTPRPVASGQHVIEHLADKMGIAVVRPIVNINQWALIDELGAKAEQSDLSIGKPEVMGWWLLSRGNTLRPVGYNFMIAIRNLSEWWRGGVTSGEIVEAAVFLKGKSDQEIRTAYEGFDRSIMGLRDEFGRDVNLSNWSELKRIVEGWSDPDAKKYVLGFVFNDFASSISNPQARYTDIVGSLSKALGVSGDSASFADWWSGISTFLQLAPGRQQQLDVWVNQSLGPLQDKLTQQNMQEMLGDHEDKKHILVITGYNHEGGVIPFLEKF